MSKIDLFTPLKLGAIETPNRIFMAPMTRCRAGDERTANELMARYYVQRASAGLLITEATQVSPTGIGYPGTPGIHTEAQAAGWRKVTDAVHDAGGRIFCQLWHVGRSSHSLYQPNGQLPVSSSAVAISVGEIYTPQGPKPYETPRALEPDEIRGIIGDFAKGAALAKKAGFDGVELHGANGYLPDQFLRDGVNRRTDEWGGTVEKRSRFHLEVTKALIDVWGASRVGVRLSPSGTFNDMKDSNPKATFGHVITELGKLNLAYLHIMAAMEGDLKHAHDGHEAIPVSYFRPMFKGPLVTNSGFDAKKAQTYLSEGWADAVAFGVSFLANPDLPERFSRNAPLNPPSVDTFYGGGEKGYVDYPALGA